MNTNYHYIIIHNAEKLSKNAQYAIRKILDKCILTIKIIFIVNNISSLIDPINSRCITIKLSSPDIETINKICNKICISTGHTYNKEIMNCINKERNLIESLNYLQNNILKIECENILDTYITDIYLSIISTKSIDDIVIIKSIINNISSISTSFSYISKSLYLQLINHYQYDQELSYKITDILSTYTQKSNNVSNYIIFFECMIIDIIFILFEKDQK